MRATERWDAVRSFALGFPAAEEDRPWGGPVVVKVRRRPGPPPWRKDGEGVHGPVFVWLGDRDATEPAVAVKLAASRDMAIAVADARPTTISGLGQWGWVTVPLWRPQLDVELLCEWIEESYRSVAPKRSLVELDGRSERPPLRLR